MTINEDGFVWDVQVMSGHPLLNEAAITAVKQWQYSRTLLNGEPVPVETTVTVMFNFMGLDDLPVMMDESGNLSIELERIRQVKGTVYIRIEPSTPFRVAESVVRDLMQKGEQKIVLSGPYVLYQGQLFYNGPPSPGAPPASFGAGNVRRLPDSLAAEMSKRKSVQFHCRIYYNQAGEAVGLQRMGGDEFPELEKEILLIREEPVLINGEPVPFARNFDWVIGAPKID